MRVDNDVLVQLSAHEQRRLLEQSPTHDTLAAALQAAGEQPCPDHTQAYTIMLDSHGREERLTHTTLWTEACRVAAGMRAHGVSKGDRVLVMVPTSVGYLTVVCGAILLGAVPCTLAGPTSRGKTDEVLHYLAVVCATLEPALIVVNEPVYALMQEVPRLGPQQVVCPAALQEHGVLTAGELPVIVPEDPLHIQLTSGSTSMPKGVVLTHAQAIANIQAITQAVAFAPRTESTLVWLPLYHDMGFVQLLICLYYQARLVLMTPFSFLRQPLSWLRMISQYQVVMSAAPTFAYRTCVQKYDPAKLADVDLSTWRRAFVGAEPVSRQVLDAFLDCFAPYGLSSATLYPCYGMAETVLATTLHQRPAPDGTAGFLYGERIAEQAVLEQNQAVPCVDPAVPAMDILSMGQPVHGLTLSVQSADGQLLDERMIGEICVRGTSLMQGYFRNPDATAAAIRDGWYHTGDRGYLAGGDLYVLGRIKELIIVRGRNYLPYDLEALVEQHPEVRQGYAVAFGSYNAQEGTEDVIVVVETKAPVDAHPPMIQEIQQALQQTFGFRAHAVLCVRHGTIPRTTSGKRQRVLSQQWYREGRFHTAATDEG